MLRIALAVSSVLQARLSPQFFLFCPVILLVSAAPFSLIRPASHPQPSLLSLAPSLSQSPYLPALLRTLQSTTPTLPRRDDIPKKRPPSEKAISQFHPPSSHFRDSLFNLQLFSTIFSSFCFVCLLLYTLYTQSDTSCATSHPGSVFRVQPRDPTALHESVSSSTSTDAL